MINYTDTSQVVKATGSYNSYNLSMSCGDLGFSYSNTPTRPTWIPMDYLIKDVEFYPPAVKMTFVDGAVTIAVAQGGDEYDPEIGMMTCIMKYLYKGNSYNNLFRKFIKKDEQKKQKAAKEIAKKEEAAAIKKRQEEKKERRRKAWVARKRQKQIEVMAEAYKKALKEITVEKEEK